MNAHTLRFLETPNDGGFRLDAPDTWCDWHVNTPVSEIAKAQLKVSNRGVDVFDAFDLPLLESFSKTSADHMKVGVVKYEPHKIVTHYNDDPDNDLCIDYDSWFAEEPCPYSVSLNVGKVSMKTSAPEIKAVKTAATITPVQTAIKFAALQASTGSDPSNFLRTVEMWWKLPEFSLDFCILPSEQRLSIPRLIASFNKTSSPLYGFDNYAGTIAVHKTGFTKQGFLRDSDIGKFQYVVADFGRFNSFLKYAMVSNLALPGKSRNAIVNVLGELTFTVNPNYAKKYGDKDFEVFFPKLDFQVTKEDPALNEAIRLLSDPDYLIELYAEFNEVALLNDNEVALQKKPVLAKNTRVPIPEFDMEEDVEHIKFTTYSSTSVAVKYDAQVVIDALYTAEFSDRVVAANVAAVEVILFDHPSHVPLREDVSFNLVKSLAVTIAPQAIHSLHAGLSSMKTTLDKLYAQTPKGLSLRTTDALKVSYISVFRYYQEVIRKSRLYKAQIASVGSLPSKFVTNTLSDADRVTKTLASYASYYLNKSMIPSGVSFADLSTTRKSKVVSYQFLYTFYATAVWDIRNKLIIYPDLRIMVKDRAAKYAHKRKKVFTPPDSALPVEDYADELDGQLDPEVPWRSLVDLALKYKRLLVKDLVDKPPDKIDKKFLPKYHTVDPTVTAVPQATSLDMLAMLELAMDSEDLVTIEDGSRANLKPADKAIEYLRAEVTHPGSFFVFATTKYCALIESFEDFRDTVDDLTLEKATADLEEFSKQSLSASTPAHTRNVVDSDLN